MKVVFIKNVKGVGNVGDVKDVSDGYARNYLLPAKLAQAATEGRVKAVSQQLARDREIKEIADVEAKELADQLEGQVFEIIARAGESGKLFGSVNKEAVAEEISKRINRVIPENAVEMDEPIKMIGEYQLIIKLNQKIKTKIKVQIQKESK